MASSAYAAPLFSSTAHSGTVAAATASTAKSHIFVVRPFETRR